jgi:uncharacterized coiled-coil protein SlyX
MDNLVTIITGVIQTGAISFLVFMIIRGLKTEIMTLNKQIEIQNQTIVTMDKRIAETEKIGDLYKQLISDFPKALDDYQAVITKTKDSTIYELKSRLEEQHLAIGQLKQIALKDDENTSNRKAVIGTLFLNEENQDLLHFIQSIDNNIAKVFEAIVKNMKFYDLISSLNMTIISVEESKSNDIISVEKFQELNGRSLTVAMQGSYLLTTDDKIFITKELLCILQKKYESLK